MKAAATTFWVLAVVILSTSALASHPESAQARRFRFALVGNFYECNEPNTATESGGVSACTPPAPTDFCTLTPGWSGNLSGTVTGSLAKGNQDVKLVAVARGLSCEGEVLCISLSMRATSDDCPEGSCTTVNLDDQRLQFAPVPWGGCCVVTGGVCRIRTTLLTAYPGFVNGKNSGIAISGCGLQTTLPGLPHPPALTCGILLP